MTRRGVRCTRRRLAGGTLVAGLCAGALALAASGAPAGAQGAETETLESDVRALAGDATQGRANATPGSALAQDHLIDRLDGFAEGLDSSAAGDAAFQQHFTDGTNILAVIRGTELPDEYVMVGAHYDGLGTSCRGAAPDDEICNGATDNATGAAAVLSIGEQIAQEGPRRSVILAFWDREEDGLIGSGHYVQNPLVPLSQTVAYINYDIAGANLSPSLRAETIAVGAETGGDRLVAAVADATVSGPLRTHLLSAIFGQGRSDYVHFIGAAVPTVFFTDATGPCYHTVDDEPGIVDFDKLTDQMRAGLRLTRELASTDALPAFSGDNPLATYADAVELGEIAELLVADIERFTPAQQEQALAFHEQLLAIIAAGPQGFSGDDVGVVLGGAAQAVSMLSTGACDGFLDGDDTPSTTTSTTTGTTVVPAPTGRPPAPPAAPVVATPSYTG